MGPLNIVFWRVYLVQLEPNIQQEASQNVWTNGSFYKSWISEVSRNYTPGGPWWLMSRWDIPDDERREHVITLIECR